MSRRQDHCVVSNSIEGLLLQLVVPLVPATLLHEPVPWIQLFLHRLTQTSMSLEKLLVLTNIGLIDLTNVYRFQDWIVWDIILGHLLRGEASDFVQENLIGLIAEATILQIHVRSICELLEVQICEVFFGVDLVVAQFC